MHDELYNHLTVDVKSIDVFLVTPYKLWKIICKEKLGLYEFAHELYPEQFAEESDEHPLPFTHYKWVKDIIFKSDIEPPEEEYRKINVWKTGNLK